MSAAGCRASHRREDETTFCYGIITRKGRSYTADH